MNVMERLAGLPPMITVEEASKLLGVSRSAGYRAAAIGQTPTLRGGRWRPDAPYRASHLATYDAYWRTQVGPKLGRYPLARITKQVVQRFVSDVQRERNSAWVTEHALRLLRKLLMEAMDAELIARNP